MFITKSNLIKQLNQAYEEGILEGKKNCNDRVTRAYQLGWQLRQVDLTNKGTIIGSQMCQDIDEIMKRARF